MLLCEMTNKTGQLHKKNTFQNEKGRTGSFEVGVTRLELETLPKLFSSALT